MKTLDLVAAIFEDCETPYAYVAAPSVIDGEKKLYEPLLSAMRRLGCYNGFDGRKQARGFLAVVKEKLEPDEASVLPGCVTLRLWWD